MIGIYKVIDKIFADTLQKYGYRRAKMIKSSIHPSVIYTMDVYRLQIGFDYEESKPYANLYNFRRTVPVYAGNSEGTVKEKMMYFCKQIDEFLGKLDYD